MTGSLKSLLSVLASLVLTLSAPSLLHGQVDSDTGKQGCTLRNFRVLTEVLGDERAKKLPAANAGDAAWDQAIAESTGAWRRLMSLQGIALGQEAKVLHDPESETLSVYTTVEAAHLVEVYINDLCTLTPKHITFTLDVLEGPSATVRSLTAEAQPLPSHVKMLREFEALVARNEAKHMGTLRLEGRSGQRSTLQSGPEQEFPHAFIRHEPGAITTLGEIRCTGIKLEVEPIIAPDGWMMDLCYNLEAHNAPPQRREVPAPPLGDAQFRKLPVYDFSLANITSNLTYNGDDTKLLGVWTPCKANGQPRPEVLQAAFLRMAPVALVRDPNPLVETKLREHLHRQGRILAVEAKPQPTLPVGKGMKRQEFKVPRSFLFYAQVDRNADRQQVLILREEMPSCIVPVPKPAQAVPADPFEPLDHVTRWIVPFPEGTDIRYHQSKSTLEVVHTDEGLRNVDRFLGFLWTRTPMLLAFSLHIVQADGATLREMAKNSATRADHTGTWAKMEELTLTGKATVLSTQRMEARSGQRSSFIVGQEHATVDAFQKNDKGRIEAETNAKVIGTSWEIDPILYPDLHTIDINLSLEYHFAPLQPPPSDTAPTPDVGSEAEKTYAAKVQSAYTLQSGTTRLISLWKPSGTPELDSKDVLQAAFLRADVVPVVDRENP